MIDFTLGDAIRFIVTFKDNSGTAFNPSSTWARVYDSSSTVVVSATALGSGTSTGIFTYDWQSDPASHKLGPGAFEAFGLQATFTYRRRETLFKLV